VDPTRGATIRTDAAREQKSDRARRRLPLRAFNDRGFEDVVVRNAHPPTRDRQIWSALTAPDVIGRTRQTAMHSRNSGAMRRKKAALTAFHAECLQKADGGHKAWVQAKATTSSGESAIEFRTDDQRGWPRSTTSGNCGARSGGVAVCCRPNSPAPSTRSVPTEMPATPQTSNPSRTTWPCGAHWNTSPATDDSFTSQGSGVAD
jgi:hypothetical protein